MRVVLDTNTVVSGLLWRGPPRQLLDAVRETRITLYSSTALVAELAEVIARERFLPHLRAAGVSAVELVVDFARARQARHPRGDRSDGCRRPR